MTTANRLLELYRKCSKHSQYQTISPSLYELMPKSDIEVKSRYEFERFDYIKSKLDFKGKRVLDIGGNTGFFSFEAINAGASEVILYEGNKDHADFVSEAARIIDVRVDVRKEYLNFDVFSFEEKYDIIFLLNVLHHYGDDFGEGSITMDVAKSKMVESIQDLSKSTEYLVLQMGFCWKGNREKLLFDSGTKMEMIEFISDNVRDSWEIEYIGIPEVIESITRYVAPTVSNLRRDDSVGEFRNRPIFILRSRRRPFSKIEEVAFLNGLVPDYRDVAPYSQIKKDIIIEMIKGNVDLHQTSRVLQLGCSNGYETRKLAEIFNHVDVVDGSDIFVDKALISNNFANVTYHVSLFEEMDMILASNAYNYIFCSYVLEHVYDSVFVLSVMKKLLREGGLLFVVVPNAGALSRRLAFEMGLSTSLTALTENDLTHGHRRVYTMDRIMTDVAMAGMKIIDYRGVIFKVMADFQFNSSLRDGIINESYIRALQHFGDSDSTKEYCDSYFLVISR